MCINLLHHLYSPAKENNNIVVPRKKDGFNLSPVNSHVASSRYLFKGLTSQSYGDRNHSSGFGFRQKNRTMTTTLSGCNKFSFNPRVKNPLGNSWNCDGNVINVI